MYMNQRMLIHTETHSHTYSKIYFVYSLLALMKKMSFSDRQFQMIRIAFAHISNFYDKFLQLFKKNLFCSLIFFQGFIFCEKHLLLNYIPRLLCTVRYPFFPPFCLFIPVKLVYYLEHFEKFFPIAYYPF